MSCVDPVCVSESEDIAWFERTACTKAEGRRWGEETWGRYDLKVRQGHVRSLGLGDCPAHPDGERGEWDEDEDCRCVEIEEGWFDSCSYRHPGAIACWRVEPISDQAGGE